MNQYEFLSYKSSLASSTKNVNKIQMNFQRLLLISVSRGRTEFVSRKIFSPRDRVLDFVSSQDSPAKLSLGVLRVKVLGFWVVKFF